MEEGASGLTRRQFVGRSGGAVGLLSLVSVGWPAERLASALASSFALAPARAATYAALVDALALAPEAGVVDPGQSRAAMASWYPAAPKATRAYIDAVLDSLAQPAFTGRRPSERLVLLRYWTGHGRHGAPASAVLLGVPPTDPDTDTPAPSLAYLQP
jgi:hypothetical protein